MNNPKISICIPAYNREKFLYEALFSVINQTYKNIEIIVSDDNSDINLKKIVDIFNDKRIKFFRQEKNIGLNVTGGPSAGQMWDSLHRPHAGSFGGNMSQETAVYFTTTDTRPGKASF